MSNPHDALFKLVFADPEHAGSLLRSAIPAELARAIDWQSLERVSISFVDEELSERYADLLFAAKLGDRPALLYFLCEHQSTSDPSCCTTARAVGLRPRASWISSISTRT